MTEEHLEYFAFDPSGPTVQRTIYQPSELLGPQPRPPEEPTAPPEPPVRPKRPTRLRARRKRPATPARDVGLDVPELPPPWGRLFVPGYDDTASPTQHQALAHMRELEHDIHADIDARVDPDYMSPAAMQQRIALIRQWRAEITTLQAVVWNESRTVCRWESNPNLALIVLEQIEDKLRRAAAL